MQILTGIWLRMYYLPDANNAFNSIERIMRDVNLGWFFRYSHRNGASFLFFFYICILLGEYIIAVI